MPLHSASEMTYIVSSGALNSTHSLMPLHQVQNEIDDACAWSN